MKQITGVIGGALLLLGGLAPLATAAAQEAKLQVTKPAWQGYEQYLATATEARHGYFAMSRDGQIWGQAGCPRGSCPPDEQLKASALKRCEQFSAGTPCVIFAEDRAILVPYEVKDYTMYGQ
jgi:hypothetical protein